MTKRVSSDRRSVSKARLAVATLAGAAAAMIKGTERDIGWGLMDPPKQRRASRRGPTVAAKKRKKLRKIQKESRRRNRR